MVVKQTDMPMIQDFKQSSFEICHLKEVMDEVDEFFQPSLKKRITMKSNVRNFEEYIHKVVKHGKILVKTNLTEIEGFTMFYSNDKKDFIGYIPLVAVRKHYFRQGVGKNLIHETIRELRRNGIKSVRVNTWKENLAAISLYKNFGFEVISNDNSDVLLELNIF